MKILSFNKKTKFAKNNIKYQILIRTEILKCLKRDLVEVNQQNWMNK